MDQAGRALARARLPEGVAGMARLHAMIGEQPGEDAEAAGVRVGIETDRGLWAVALAAAGYVVYGINPLQVARYRERRATSGAKSDAADAHVLADMVRTDAHQLRPVAGDSAGAQAIRVVARAHKTLIWERTRQVQRLRHALRDYFPAALQAYQDLDAPDTLELLAKAPDPAAAARLTTAQVSAALRRARRRNIKERTAAIRAALRSQQLAQPPAVTAAYATAKARKNYAATSPVTRQSGKKKTVTARHVHNDRLRDALDRQAFAALATSPGARAYYDQLRARGASHPAALRQLANRLVGILHGCLKTRTLYDEATAWSHRVKLPGAA